MIPEINDILELFKILLKVMNNKTVNKNCDLR